MNNYWLVKQEPSSYPFEQLLKDKKTVWDGIRNYQARNYLKQMSVGDTVLYYHSGDQRAVVGIAKVHRAPYPDPNDNTWVVVDLVPIKPLPQPVPLSVIKADAVLNELPLIKQGRLSVMPITRPHYDRLLTLSGRG